MRVDPIRRALPRELGAIKLGQNLIHVADHALQKLTLGLGRAQNEGGQQATGAPVLQEKSARMATRFTARTDGRLRARRNLPLGERQQN